MNSIIEKLIGYSNDPAFIVTGIGYAAILTIFIFRLMRSRDRLSISSHRVVLIGPSRVGKTSSVVAALDIVRRGRIYNGLARLRSEATISRVSKLASILDSGGFPPATKEDETNVYRFDYAVKIPAALRFLATAAGISTLFRVEIADFAGEQSEKYFIDADALSKENMPDDFGINASHNFLKWVSESDICAIYIDCEKVAREGSEYIRAITEKYITFWTFYLDIHADNIFSAKAPPVMVVYTKADEMLTDTERMARYGSASLRTKLDRQFSDLLDFLGQNAGDVRSVAISVVARDGEERLGIEEFVHYLLPGRGKL